MRLMRNMAPKDGIAGAIEHIETQIDELLVEVSLVKEQGDSHDEELEDLYFEANALKERMTNVIHTYHLV